jgi:cellulose synthase/poly-beta-1,6-N-acetylglucosamine synthase-like glycosyltransferase
MTGLILVFVVVHLLILYSWLMFPALLALVSRIGRRPAAPDGTSNYLPPLTLLLSAYNEEGHIGNRVRNLLEMDYPAELWRAYIGIDGSKDGTAAEALQAAAGHENVVILNYASNRGKVAVLKDLVARAGIDSRDADILVFTDANTAFEAGALRRLCRRFSDPSVGGVCGRLIFVTARQAETEENVYWRLEQWLKEKESSIDSCLGANGAIYAIRGRLFWNEIPSNTIIDDFVIGMKIREQGYRMIYEPQAVAFEDLPARLDDEWKRRVRIGAGNFQALQLCAPCLSGRFGLFAWMFWSHKVLRWVTPHLMIAGGALAITLTVVSHGPAGPAFLGTYAAVAIAALLGRFSRARKGRLMQLLRVLEYMIAMQMAIFGGFLRFCRGNLEGRWQRTSRG